MTFKAVATLLALGAMTIALGCGNGLRERLMEDAAPAAHDVDLGTGADVHVQTMGELGATPGGCPMCSFEQTGQKICNGNDAVLVCVDNHWKELERCGDATACVLGKCEPIGFGCGDSAYYNPNSEGAVVVTAVEPSQMVTDCIPGGDVGRTVKYTEDVQQVFRRTVVLHSFTNCAVLVDKRAMDDAFGVDTTAEVRSFEGTDQEST